MPSKNGVVLFGHPDMFRFLESCSLETLNTLPFGVVVMNSAGVVEAYNLFESRLSGLSAHKVVGRKFFSEVAPCADNESVSGRFDKESDLDFEIDYTFSFRMAPSNVRLRLLKRLSRPQQYLLVQKR